MNTLKPSITPNSYVNLHMHTTFSDGRWTVEALIDHLCAESFNLVAITDHDRPDTAEIIQKSAREKGINILPAAEMSSAWKGKLVDLLCFGFEPGQNALTELAAELLKRQQENSREVCGKLVKLGHALSTDTLMSVLALPNVEQPNAIARALLNHGSGLEQATVGMLMTETGCEVQTNPPATVVDAAHKSGAVCVLAHPGRNEEFIVFTPELLDEFRQEAEIDGLEVYYPRHSEDQLNAFEVYAQKHHLLMSAGSDSHTPEKPPLKYKAELVIELLKRLNIQVA